MPKDYVKSRLEFIPPDFQPWVVESIHRLLPFFLRFRTVPWLMGSITDLETTNVEALVKLYEQFQGGKVRFLMAFRHGEVEDPLCLLHLLSKDVPRQAQKMGIQLQTPIHTHFIYDRGITIWGGDLVGWLLSKSGGVPIHRGKQLDRLALKTARELLLNGKLPLTIAPEGATNGHGEIISPLELGAAQLSCWCAEDLKKGDRPEDMVIVPIGIRYFFPNPPWSGISQLLSQLEADSGVEVDPTADLYDRLLGLGEHLLSAIEQFYQRFYHCPIVPPPEGDRHGVLKVRLENFLNTALGVAEVGFGLEKQGTIVDRCRRLEEVSWHAIYREDITDVNELPPMQRGLANWTAEEAALKVRHMRLVESLVAVTGSYVNEKPTAERFAETLWILYDVMAKIKQVETPRRPFLGERKVKMVIGEPIPVRQRWEAAQGNRQAVKQLVVDLTEELEQNLTEAIA